MIDRIDWLVSFGISCVLLVAVGHLFLAMVHGLLKKLIAVNDDIKKYARLKKDKIERKNSWKK